MDVTAMDTIQKALNAQLCCRNSAMSGVQATCLFFKARFYSHRRLRLREFLIAPFFLNSAFNLLFHFHLSCRLLLLK